MSRYGLWLVILISLPLLADRNPGIDVGERRSIAPIQPDRHNGYVFDITVQNEQQLDVILNRAERLKGQFSPNEHGRIALVLHGEELRLFQKSNYSRFHELVERARQLDQSQLIDIKACQTTLDYYHIDRSELPDFIEQVPLAPVEIDRLQREQGFTRL